MSLIFIFCIILSLVTQAESVCSCTNHACSKGCDREGGCGNLYDCICQCVQGHCTRGCGNQGAACHSSSNCRRVNEEPLANSASMGLNEGSEEVRVEDHITFDDVPEKFSFSIPDEVELINAKRISDSETEFESSWGAIHIVGMHSSNEKYYSGVQIKLDGVVIGEKFLEYQKSKCFKVQRSNIHGKICVISEREGIFLTAKLVTQEGIIATSKPLNLLPNGIEGIAMIENPIKFNSIFANPTSAKSQDMQSLSNFIHSVIPSSLNFFNCMLGDQMSMFYAATFIRRMDVSSKSVNVTSLTAGSSASLSITVAGAPTAFTRFSGWWSTSEGIDFAVSYQSFTVDVHITFQCDPMYAKNFVAQSVIGSFSDFKPQDCDVNDIIKTNLNTNFAGKALDAATGICP